jgi:hypothetical protein
VQFHWEFALIPWDVMHFSIIFFISMPQSVDMGFNRRFVLMDQVIKYGRWLAGYTFPFVICHRMPC